MPTTAIVGINWGDEGKGRMVDLFASDYDVVVRYQGGNNAGHTVINQYGKFALNLIPSGVFNAGVRNVLGNGVVIDIEHLFNEIGRIRNAGISIT
ncbi:MAG: adenylosuccinate synthetase, partial [Bacillota bacterium]